MTENVPADHLVVDLEFWGHELDNPHFGYPEFTRLLEDLYICDDLPGCRREADKEGYHAKESVNRVEHFVLTGSLVVGEAETG